MSKNWIIIPDVHGRTFWREAVRGRENENIIFLGDYLDPYPSEGITPEKAYRELLDIIDFKKEHMDNVVLLLGNHDLGYLDPEINMVRRDTKGAMRNYRILHENLNLFDLVHSAEIGGKRVLFSHAGIRNSWAEECARLFGSDRFEPSVLNEMLHSPKKWSLLSSALSWVSSHRGGYDRCGSVVWTDLLEFAYNDDFLPGYTQVFGHTLHEGAPILVRGTDGEGLCMDCREAFMLDGDARLFAIKESASVST